MAIFLLLYVTRWCLRLIKFHWFLLVALRKSFQYEKKPWQQMLETEFPDSWKEILHVVILPVSKEMETVLDSALRAIKFSLYPQENIMVVLACEERNSTTPVLSANLEKKYKTSFRDFITIFHPDNLPDEARSKGSNITYAATKISALLKEQNVDPAKVLVTALDADNIVHPVYFSTLTYHYLKSENRIRKSFQPLPVAFSNIWEVPVFNRIIALVNSYWQFSRSSQPDHYLKNTAAYAQSLEALESINFWSKQSINEDTHQYWRAYFHFRGDHQVIPLFIPIYQDAVQSRTYIGTLKSQYLQLRRWAFSASDVAYVIIQFFKNFKKLPFWKTLHVSVQYFDTHVMWATGPIVVLFYNFLPSLLNQSFGHTVFFYNLATILHVYSLIALLSGVIFSVLSLVMLPNRPKGFFRSILSFCEWILAPLVVIFFGALPALDAQLRLLFGKSLEFQVTEKYRTFDRKQSVPIAKLPSFKLYHR